MDKDGVLRSGNWSRLCEALADTDPHRGWTVALRLLQSGGFVRVEEGQPTGALLIEAGRKLVSFTAPQNATGDELSAVRGLLTLALQRLEESEARARAEERYQMLSSASFEGIMIHERGSIIDANQRLAELLGYELTELVNTSPIPFCVAEEDRDAVAARMAASYEGCYVITGVRKDGSRFRAELQTKQSKLGDRPLRVAAVRDVTEREQMLARLRESEQRLQELTDSAFEITVLSRDGVILDARGKLPTILGYEAHEVIGHSLLELVAPSALASAQEILKRRQMGTYEITVRHKNGELVPVEVVATESTLDGVPIRIAGVRDLSQKLRSEEERRQLERQLEQAQRLESLGVLAGGIAHDFNNLLVGILGQADLLRAEFKDPDILESLDSIVDAGQRAAELTAKMLAYAGRAEFAAAEPVSLSALLEELKSLLSASLSKKATLELDVHPDCVVEVEKASLTQVLLNLLVNASESLQNDAGTIRVSGQTIQTPGQEWDTALGATVSPGRWILLTVADSGVGMSAQTQARIFEPFFTTKRSGHDLGLAACLGIVRSWGGAIRVESAVGQGTQFSLLLKNSDKTPGANVESCDLAVDTPCRVIVVDDEVLVRRQLRRSLELRSYQVHEASSGEEGLAELRERGAELMLIDMTLPGLDGPEIVRQIRAEGFNVPIVLTSGYTDSALERRLEPGSFQAFLPKPYLLSELMQAVYRARSAG